MQFVRRALDGDVRHSCAAVSRFLAERHAEETKMIVSKYTGARTAKAYHSGGQLCHIVQKKCFSSLLLLFYYLCASASAGGKAIVYSATVPVCVLKRWVR